MHPIRSELEIITFGRGTLVKKFASSSKVRSLRLLNFIDGFSLHRNIRRSIIGFYFIPVGLSYVERKRRANVLPFTLSLYGSNISDVVEAIGPLLRALDASEYVTLPGKLEQTLIYPFTMLYISNMP